MPFRGVPSHVEPSAQELERGLALHLSLFSMLLLLLWLLLLLLSLLRKSLFYLQNCGPHAADSVAEASWVLI